MHSPFYFSLLNHKSYTVVGRLDPDDVSPGGSCTCTCMHFLRVVWGEGRNVESVEREFLIEIPHQFPSTHAPRSSAVHTNIYVMIYMCTGPLHIEGAGGPPGSPRGGRGNPHLHLPPGT